MTAAQRKRLEQAENYLYKALAALNLSKMVTEQDIRPICDMIEYVQSLKNN